MIYPKLTIVGAPTSAGAYGPDQEKAPDALRAAGLIQLLKDQKIDVVDKMNTVSFRWEVDTNNTKAMNLDLVRTIASEVSDKVFDALKGNGKVLVIGGDCTIELGCGAACLKKSDNIGLIYIDLDTDLNTPTSVNDGALDWMGVAHLLMIDGAEKKLASIGRKMPMLLPNQIHFYANGNETDFERDVISNFNIQETPLAEVLIDPAHTAKRITEGWARQFDHVLIHLDVDVLNFNDIQLAENYRRNIGLTLKQLLMSLKEFLQAPNWSILTITEINPDHGALDGSTLRHFSESLAEVIGSSLTSK